MTWNLVRYHESGDLHFLTFSCYQRRPYLATPDARAMFEGALETIRARYEFFVAGYVVMPEHIHLLVSEPRRVPLAKAIQALKLSVAVKSLPRPFWQHRYYDFNVFSDKKRVEKLRYVHRNPVARGLVTRPEEWGWSSFRYYQTGFSGVVGIESQ